MIDGGEPGSLVGALVGLMRPLDLIRPSTPSSRRRFKRLRRRPSTGAVPSHRVEKSASTILGPTHPLTRAIEAVDIVARQWRACGAVLLGASIAQLEDHPWADGLAIGAGIVLVTLTALIAALMTRARDCATELIAEGREMLPIAAVQRQRRRLLTPRRTRILAKTLGTMIRQVTSPPRIKTSAARPLFDERVIASVSDDIRAVIELLKKDHVRAQGVALTERLIVDGGSPLYARDETQLREELHRVLHLMEE